MLPHPPRPRGRGGPAFTQSAWPAQGRLMATARGIDLIEARDPGSAEQVEEATMTTATRDRQAARTRGRATPRAAPRTGGGRRCRARRHRGLLGRSGVRGSDSRPRRRAGRRVRVVRRVRRIRRVCDAGLPAGDGDAVSGRGAHRHGAAVPERPGRGHGHGAHGVRPGPHELPRRRGRGDDHGDRRDDRPELHGERGRHRPVQRRRTPPAHRGLGPHHGQGGRRRRRRSGTRSRRSATPAGPGR